MDFECWNMFHQQLDKLQKTYKKELTKLLKDNQILQTKIDKTLAYIKSHKSYWEEWHYDNCGVDDDIEEIIKILKGEK